MGTTTALRIEIVEASTQILSLAKWKLAVVAALGGVGLGLAGAGNGNSGDALLPPYYLLCLIPFVCLYCDLLWANALLRVYAIGMFLSDREDARDPLVAEYEKWLRKMRLDSGKFRHLFLFESLAINGLTIVLSAMLVLCWWRFDGPVAFGWCGLCGFVGSLLLLWRFKAKENFFCDSLEKKGGPKAVEGE